MNYQLWLLGDKFSFLTSTRNHISGVLIKHFERWVEGVCFQKHLVASLAWYDTRMYLSNFWRAHTAMSQLSQVLAP